MEITKAIYDAENALRDFVEASLANHYGKEWQSNSDIPAEKIRSWNEIKAGVENNLPPESAAEGLIYHTPFSDLIDVIVQHWDTDFQEAFGDKHTFVTYLKILELYRDPNIHRRELFVHQKHLILGVSGEVRSKITAYRAMRASNEGGFPIIEYIKDNFGNLWVPGKPRRVKTSLSLSPGDRIEFVVKASDPEDLPIEYRIQGEKWQPGNILIFDVLEKHIKRIATFSIAIRSTRKHHAYPLGYDDRIVFEYQILPKGE